MSEVRGSGRECQAATAQDRPGGATPRPRSGAGAKSASCDSAGTAERSYPMPEAAAGRSNPTSNEWWLRGRRRA